MLRWAAASVLALSLVCIARIPNAAATLITWDLVETSCTSSNGGCTGLAGTGPLDLPVTLGSITLPEYSGGTYTDQPGDCGGMVCYIVTASGDFFVALPHVRTSSPSFGSYCPADDIGDCEVNIELSGSPGGISGEIDFNSIGDMDNDHLGFDGLNFGGLWGSDAGLLGCGFFAQCTISGNLVLVPEPSSATILLGALFGLFLFPRRRSRIGWLARSGALLSRGMSRFAIGVGLVLLLIGVTRIPSATAMPVTSWSLVETSCSAFDDEEGGCKNSAGGPIGLPLKLGYVSLPFYPTGGTYIDQVVSCDGTACNVVTESGDFELDLPFFTPNPFFGPYCPLELGTDCFADIELTSSPPGLSGVINYTDSLGLLGVVLNIDGLSFSGSWGSDGPLEGCGFDADCDISGVLLATVPEPSSATILLGALFGLFLFGRRERKRRRHV